MRAIITGIGHFYPEQKLTNKDLEQKLDTNDEWITTRTGIKERRILEDGKGASYMAVKAARMVLEQKNISADELDLIIMATATPDSMVPCSAAWVQKELKASKCWGFDLNGACSGFIFALATGSQFVETGKHKKVLVIGTDKMSSIIDPEDRNTRIIFGDAAGAVLLEPSEEDDYGVNDFINHLDGAGGKYLYVPAGGSVLPPSHETVDKRMHYVKQDGRTVFKNAVIGMYDVSAKVLQRNGLTAKDVKLFIPHQANIRIINSVAEKMGLNQDQVVINIEKYGNTTAATIPLAMSEAYREKRMSKGDWILLASFGAGFTWGSILLKWAID